MSEYVIHVTDVDFEQVVSQAKMPVIVDFWAIWCRPCKAFAPVFEETANDYVDKIKFVKADVDQNGEAARKYSIRGVPTIILFRNGEIKATKVGALSKSQLTEFLNSNI